MEEAQHKCVNCLKQFDLLSRTAYKLPCDHSGNNSKFPTCLACKPCLRVCHKNDQDFFCFDCFSKTETKELSKLRKNMEIMTQLTLQYKKQKNASREMNTTN